MSRQYSYSEIVRAQRRGEHGTAAKDAMRGLAGISLVASAMFWGPIQWQLVEPTTWGETAIAISGALFIIIGPPVLVSFLIPWSPAGMLLAKLKARTVGQMVVLACGLFLLYYSGMILMSWWQARPVVAEAGLAKMQTIIGIIAYILVPALLWAPVSSEEMAEELKQAQLVKRYEMQTAADIAILQTTLLRAQQKAAVGFANLAAGERQELADVMRGLVSGIDQTIQEISGNLSQAAGVALELRSPLDDGELPQLLGYVADELANGRMVAHETTQGADPVPAPPIAATLPAAATAYAAARRALGDGAWMRRELEAALSIEKTKASQLISAWRAQGLVVGVPNPKDHYIFVGG